MVHLLSFLRGLVALAGAIVLVYLGARILDRWHRGFRRLLVFLLVLPAVFFLAAYSARLLTFGALGETGGSVVALFVLIVVGGVYQIRNELDQLARLRSTGEALGLASSRTLEVDPGLRENPLLRKHFQGTANHGLKGRYNDADLLLFNFGYEDISDDSPDSYFRTAVVFTDPTLDLPEFELRRSGLGHRIFGAFFKGKDIELPQDPDFSKHYRLQGPDPTAMRRLFEVADRRIWMEAPREWAMGAKDHTVVLYVDARSDEQVEPDLEEISGYLEEAWILFEALRQAAKVS